ncbi:MAG: AIR synthase-related protein, partial [Nitrospira sp.]|nr:AIR synthase-related protein [Nitrospira sp.]
LRFMRDPTRGGLATVMHEICHATGMGVILQQNQTPVRDAVTAVCEMLGYDPLYLACEGRVVAVLAPDDANEALHRWRRSTEGSLAAIVGEVSVSEPGRVIMETELGGQRFLEELEDSPLPRIC